MKSLSELSSEQLLARMGNLRGTTDEHHAHRIKQSTIVLLAHLEYARRNMQPRWLTYEWGLQVNLLPEIIQRLERTVHNPKLRRYTSSCSAPVLLKTRGPTHWTHVMHVGGYYSIDRL